MPTQPPLIDIPRTALNEAADHAWSDGLPAEFGDAWAYVDTLPGEYLPTVDGGYVPIDRGRARLIIRERASGQLYAMPFFESTSEADMYADRFQDEQPEFIAVEPYEQVIKVTNYRPVTWEKYPITEPIPTHVHPHVD